MTDGKESSETGAGSVEKTPASRSRWLELAARLPILAMGILVLLFPHPGRALREFRTLRDPNALIAPGDPAVERLSAEIDAAMPATLDRPGQIAWIEAFIEKRIVYAHDWDQWLNVDYWPTPSETVASGREDCDGIAVLTASVLKRRGFKPRIEASYEHVWLEVEGERILNPDKETNFDGEHWSLPGFGLILSWLRYSLTSFPLWRWATLVLWAFFVLRWPNRRRFVIEGIAMTLLLVFASAAARLLPDFLFGAVLLVCTAVLVATIFRPRPRPAT